MIRGGEKKNVGRKRKKIAVCEGGKGKDNDRRHTGENEDEKEAERYRIDRRGGIG